MEYRPHGVTVAVESFGFPKPKGAGRKVIFYVETPGTAAGFRDGLRDSCREFLGIERVHPNTKGRMRGLAVRPIRKDPFLSMGRVVYEDVLH